MKHGNNDPPPPPNQFHECSSRNEQKQLALSQRHTWRFYTPIAANLIASENRKRFSLAIEAETPGDFFRRSRRCGSFENSCDKIAQPDGLALLAICSNKRRKSRERAHLANACEFNRRYLTCQISAILYADRGDRRKSQLLHRAHLAIFADRGDRRIKSPSVSLALGRQILFFYFSALLFSHYRCLLQIN